MGKKGISVGTAMIAGSKTIIDDGNYQQIRDSYYDEDIRNRIEDPDAKKRMDRRRAIELGMSSRLIEKMCDAGADTDEYKRMILYMYLVIDMFKYSINITNAADDLKIKEILNKYK